MEPIQVVFVQLHSIPWPALLAFAGVGMTLLSTASARQYLKPAAIAPGLAQPRRVLGIVDEATDNDIETDGHSERVGQVFQKLARVGLLLTLIGGAWWAV